MTRDQESHDLVVGWLQLKAMEDALQHSETAGDMVLCRHTFANVVK